MDNKAQEKTYITARIIDEENGVKVIEKVNAVRIKSKDYRILIMVDYAPMLGALVGDVVLLTENGEVSFTNVTGYYKHQRNEFTLLIKDEFDGWYNAI